jgi:hypothetical protein
MEQGVCFERLSTQRARFISVPCFEGTAQATAIGGFLDLAETFLAAGAALGPPRAGSKVNPMRQNAAHRRFSRINLDQCPLESFWANH